ncbi:MAG: DUF859 family phage minor structural protein [Oscillospiraceae bacterium]|nr:DUF859 family phage minor structural protein [Oscillospiraceae bacterium]
MDPVIITLNKSSTSPGDGVLIGKIEWTSEKDVASNKSAVTATLYVAKENSTAATKGNWSYALSIGNQTVSGSVQLTVLDWTTVATTTIPVDHDADGTKSVSFYGSVTGPSGTAYAGLTTSGSKTFDLAAIPRASTASFGSFTMDQEGTISINRADSSFTHTILYTFGSASGTIASGVSTSCAWTPPLTLASKIPNSTSGTGGITLRTYNASGTLIGENVYAVTIYVPDDMVPTISDFSVALVNPNTVANGWGVAIKGLTKLSWSAAVSGVYGSTIAEQCLVSGYSEWTGSSGQTGFLQTAGTIQPYQYARDSRGRIARSLGEKITVCDYAAPTITDASAARCDENGTARDDGTFLKLTLAASCTSVGERNSVSLRWRYKPASGTLSGWSALSSGSVVSGFDAAASYVVELSAIDSLGSEKSVSATVPTANVAFHLKDGGLGAAFGKYAEQDNLLESVWPLKIQGNMLNDFVVETGGNAYWSWRKWASGVAECWRVRSCGNVSCTVPWGVFYESTSAYGPDAYPFAFTAVPAQMMFAGMSSGGVVFVEPGGNSAASTGSWWLYRPVSTAGITAYVSIYAIGKWK